ncbi:NGG1p interacting factor NIF3 [Cohnella pontilimi]|uniref:GTP cyclohydrolase 1 type 2 homolog n=1 Tax=Cohnella pontilimi TaxID=2564100 RepID=A0A4U0FGR2_9BACL|nr:Nif3-like dinuclear metal center hexameric protein [Cohnella pontilimi]TJY44193.1 NGG1p interacting factor NIF3 [Cohnella pontilimi]
MNHQTISIQNLIDGILQDIPGEPIHGTVDTVKAGDTVQPVMGVIVTFTVTFEVMRRAVETGANFIITHEPTFYNHRDETEKWEGNPVYEAKLRYLQGHGLTVWRFHDYAHYTKPDLILEGVAKDLGWSDYLDPARPAMAHVPPVSLQDLFRELKRKLGVPHLRYVGDPSMTCRNIGMILGAAGSGKQMEYLAREDVDTVICGETSEWDACEYVRDAMSIGQSKALIVLGHLISEEGGMRHVADLVQSRLPGIPVEYVSAGDPYRWE